MALDRPVDDHVFTQCDADAQLEQRDTGRQGHGGGHQAGRAPVHLNDLAPVRRKLDLRSEATTVCADSTETAVASSKHSSSVGRRSRLREESTGEAERRHQGEQSRYPEMTDHSMTHHGLHAHVAGVGRPGARRSSICSSTIIRAGCCTLRQETGELRGIARARISRDALPSLGFSSIGKFRTPHSRSISPSSMPSRIAENLGTGTPAAASASRWSSLSLSRATHVHRGTGQTQGSGQPRVSVEIRIGIGDDAAGMLRVDQLDQLFAREESWRRSPCRTCEAPSTYCRHPGRPRSTGVTQSFGRLRDLPPWPRPGAVHNGEQGFRPTRLPR